jgi:hypothetical protein
LSGKGIGIGQKFTTNRFAAGVKPLSSNASPIAVTLGFTLVDPRDDKTAILEYCDRGFGLKSIGVRIDPKLIALGYSVCIEALRLDIGTIAFANGHPDHDEIAVGKCCY